MEKKKKVVKGEHTSFGTKAHKGIMPAHYAAESSGVKKSTLRKEKAMPKPKSLKKKKITKK